MSDPFDVPVPSTTVLRVGTLNVGLGFVRKLPHLLPRCAALSLDAVAVQEVGDPALLSPRLSPYHLVYCAGPSPHEGGVGLLLSAALVPRIRSYHRSKTKRLIGAVLELGPGHRLLLVSAYMPTGLDHSSPASESHALAHKLYDELLRWSVGMQQVLLLGDLNETLSAQDRWPVPAPAPAAAAAAPSPIQCLPRDGFTDVFRHLHPDAALCPGFTHVIEGARPSRSRIDYIWSRGLDASALLSSTIDASLRDYSHHRLLCAELRLPLALPAACATPLHSPQLPNLRTASPLQLQSFVERLQQLIGPEQAELHALAADAESHSLSQLASRLAALTRAAAFATLPVTGAAPRRSRCVMQLQRQRHALTALLRVSSALLHRPPGAAGPVHLASSPEWRRLYLRGCVQQHSLEWSIDPCYGGDAAAWLSETRTLLRSTRNSIHQEQRRMLRAHLPPELANPAALVHRMLRSDAQPTQLHSVVDSHGELTRTAEQLESVMVDHFRSVFAIPPALAPLPREPPPMLFDKPSVQAEWFNGLMADVSEEELMSTIRLAPLVSSPGEDGVSSGLWKVALQGSAALRHLVLALFCACLRTSCFPSAWKSSVIVPLLKDEQKERSMSNIRPISLQSCLGKLLNQILAHRLGAFFARHPVLNPAQRGFINGGSITKCIDELLDAWDWSRTGQHELYSLFYDIKQAYDSVQVGVLSRALLRLRMPARFVQLVIDSLSGLTSRVRTAYGLSAPFDVERSLRQGDPLAPLLFLVLMDALHDGLELNPFSGQRHGLRMRLHGGQTIDTPSQGYADDTGLHTNTLRDLRVQNDWVHYFMAFNQLRLNHAKCELVGRGADGEPVTAAALAAHGITIEGHAVQPLAHNHAVRYLGVHVTFDGCWHTQQSKAIAKIYMFTRAITKFRVPLSHAAYMFNVFLLPSLELALLYVHGSGTNKWIKSCDRLLVGCIKHAVGSPLRLSNSAVALALHFNLPSWLEASVKVSELFLRVNSSEARWGALGRALMRHRLPSSVDAHAALSRADGGTRLSRAAWLAVNRLGWSLHLTDEHRPGSRHRHLFEREPAGAMPDGSQCTSTSSLLLAAGPAPIAHDLWQGWGAGIPAQEVHVYTDGSHDASSAPRPTSAWAATVGDDWLDSQFRAVPSDERLLLPAHVAGAALFGANILSTVGVYPAELQAIARVLAMFPTSFALHVHSDSQACIAAIRCYEQQTNERRRMRMAGRTLLQLISHLLRVRASAGGSLEIAHVKAHTTDTDIRSVGNRLADYQANLVRGKPDRASPLSLAELPLSQCEPHLHVIDDSSGLQVIDDLRRSAKAKLKRSALAKWQSKADCQGQLAGRAMVDLGQAVLRHGSPSLQAAFVHVATNSIHYQWQTDAAGVDSLQQLQCRDCFEPLSLTHLAACRSAPAQSHHWRLQRDIVSLLAEFGCTRDWLGRHRQLSLPRLLASLFPPPPAASVAEAHRLLTCAMSGAVTHRQANAAAKSIGFDVVAQAKESRAAIVRLQLLCLSSTDKLYTNLKERPP